MSGGLEAFLREGFSKYGDAKAAVSAFEKELRRRLKAPIDARRNWSPFKKWQVADARPGGEEGWGWWVPAAFIKGTTASGRSANLDLGIWWQAPGAADSPMIYASFYKEPRGALTFPFKPTDGIRSFLYEGRTILQSPIPTDLDVGRILDFELDVLLGVVRSLERANRSEG